MIIGINEARWIKDYQIWLSFNTGEEGAVDLRDDVFKYTIATPLRTIENFRDFYLDEWPTLAWPCGFDLAPEYLYELATGKQPSWKAA